LPTLPPPFRRAVALLGPSPQASSADGASTQALASILSDIGASELLQNFIDDEQDDDYLLVYKKPDHISKRYGLPASTASAFVNACRARAASLSAASVGSVLLSSRCGAEPAGHSPRFARQNFVFRHLRARVSVLHHDLPCLGFANTPSTLPPCSCSFGPVPPGIVCRRRQHSSSRLHIEPYRRVGASPKFHRR
jgi:hypothetical protein